MPSIAGIKKISTGNIGLDYLLEGGLPTGSIVLISGKSGTGKTVLCFQWLFDGIKNGENGIYITFTEPLFKTVRNIETMGFYNKKAIENGDLTILDVRKLVDSNADDFHQKLIRIIEKEVKKTNSKRVVIDSITAIAYRLDEKSKIREFIFDFGTTLSTLDCTTLLVSETSKEEDYSVYTVEEFIVDGIINLTRKQVGHDFLRYLNIAKMRGTDFFGDYTAFSILNKGIEVYPQIGRTLSRTTSSEERISSGISDLDARLGGGFYKGSSTLVSGATGTGKSVFAMHFITEGLKRGEKTLLCAFEESEEQVIRNAESLGSEWEKYEKNGLLSIRALYPSEQSPEQHLYEIGDIVRTNSIKRCAIDSISSFANSYSPPIAQYFIRRMNSGLKSMFVSSLFTSATAGFMSADELTEGHLSTITDNIIMLRYVEVSGEIKTILDVLKVRGSAHSKGLHEYSIESNKGIVIGYPLKGYEGILTGTSRKVETSIMEKMKDVFIEFLGPVGENELEGLLKKGIRKKNELLDYIDKLLEKRIITKEQYISFKSRIDEIFLEL